MRVAGGLAPGHLAVVRMLPGRGVGRRAFSGQLHWRPRTTPATPARNTMPQTDNHGTPRSQAPAGNIRGLRGLPAGHDLESEPLIEGESRVAAGHGEV